MRNTSAALMMVTTLLLPGIASAEQGVMGMEIKRKADLETAEGPEEYFTGKATITGQF